MKKKSLFWLAILVLVLATLACGSSNNEVVVNPPDAEEGEEAVEAEEVEEIEATEGPKVGTARSNPAPAGSEVVTDKMAFVITGTTRPADDIVSAGNMFNTEPESDQEYIFVDVEVTCQKSTDDKCTIYPTSSFSLIGTSGVVYDPEIMLAGVEGLFEILDTEFYGGSTVSGSLPFIINQADTDLVLVYEPILFGDDCLFSSPLTFT